MVVLPLDLLATVVFLAVVAPFLAGALVAVDFAGAFLAGAVDFFCSAAWVSGWKTSTPITTIAKGKRSLKFTTIQFSK